MNEKEWRLVRAANELAAAKAAYTAKRSHSAAMRIDVARMELKNALEALGASL